MSLCLHIITLEDRKRANLPESLRRAKAFKKNIFDIDILNVESCLKLHFSTFGIMVYMIENVCFQKEKSREENIALLTEELHSSLNYQKSGEAERKLIEYHMIGFLRL